MTREASNIPALNSRHNLDTKTIYLTVTHHQPVLEVALSAGAGWAVTIPKATSSVGGALGAEKDELSLPSTTTCSTVSLIVLPSLTNFSEDQNGTTSFLGTLEPLSWVQTEVSAGETSPSLLSPQPGHADSHSQEDSQTGPTRPQGCFRGSYFLLSVFHAAVLLYSTPHPSQSQRPVEAELARLPFSEATGAPHDESPPEREELFN